MSTRREFVGQLIAAGPTRTAGGGAGGYVVTAEAIREAIDAGLFRGLACFVDHAAQPSLRRLVGVWHDVAWRDGDDAQADDAGRAAGGVGGAAGMAVGRLRVYETEETRPVVALLEQTLAEAEPPDVGVSLVFYPRLAADGRTITRIEMVESADLVMFPASVGSRIWGAGEQGGSGAGEEGGRGAGERSGGDSHSQMATVMMPFGYPEALRSTPLAVMTIGRPALHRAAPVSLGADGPAAGGTAAGVTQQSTIQQAQEAGEMTQQDETTELRRVALVRGEEVQGSTGAGAQGEEALAGWLEALRTAAATAVIRASGLPATVQERLGAGRYESADEVYAAVEQARGELAALSEAGVVQLGGRPPRGWAGGAGGMQVRDPLDEARGLVGFFFGAADALTPPPNLRSFADLYVALTGDAHFRGIFDGDRVQFSGATTSTLPNLAVDAMNRVITQQFAALDHYRWYERITDVAPNDGRLHDMKWITLGGVGNLPAVNEGAAYTELSVADARETASFVKRGGYVGITREMIKNGDIMQLQAIPRALAAAAVRTRSAAVAGLFTSNSGVGPTLSQDSKALFHADHANLATTALGADAAAWRAARAECFQQPELGTSKPLGIFPRFLLVPAELYDVALSILGYGEGMPATYAPEAQGRGFADPRPIPLVVPDWTDATDWAYIVDPALFPVIQMSYSQSPGGRRHPIPELFAVVSETSGLMFSNDVLPIKVRDEFAVGVNGPRGIGKRNVA